MIEIIEPRLRKEKPARIRKRSLKKKDRRWFSTSQPGVLDGNHRNWNWNMKLKLKQNSRKSCITKVQLITFNRVHISYLYDLPFFLINKFVSKTFDTSNTVSNLNKRLIFQSIFDMLKPFRNKLVLKRIHLNRFAFIAL